MNENPQEDFRKLFDNKYYLFIPFSGPLINPDEINLQQVQRPKTFRGKVLYKFIQFVEYCEKLVQP